MQEDSLYLNWLFKENITFENDYSELNSVYSDAEYYLNDKLVIENYSDYLSPLESSLRASLENLNNIEDDLNVKNIKNNEINYMNFSLTDIDNENNKKYVTNNIYDSNGNSINNNDDHNKNVIDKTIKDNIANNNNEITNSNANYTDNSNNNNQTYHYQDHVNEVITNLLCNRETFESYKYKYIIFKLLGYGYYGTVFLARRYLKDGGEENKLVAIKIINFEHVKVINSNNITVDIIDQLNDEINILTTLENHCNVVNYLESFNINPHYLAFVTEYISGYTLRDIYKSYGSFPENLISYVCKSILDILIYLDSINYRYKRIHKDIKSTNIMIDCKTCKVKLLDFGVSQILDNVLHITPKISSGTLQWMSPELLFSKEYNNLTDIWSLGITLLELSIGNVPNIYELILKNNINSDNILEKYVEFLIDQINKDNINCLLINENKMIINKIKSFSKLYLDFLNKMLIVDLNKRWNCHKLINHPFIRKNECSNLYTNFQNIEKELYYYNNCFNSKIAINHNIFSKLFNNLTNLFIKDKSLSEVNEDCKNKQLYNRDEDYNKSMQCIHIDILDNVKLEKIDKNEIIFEYSD